MRNSTGKASPPASPPEKKDQEEELPVGLGTAMFQAFPKAMVNGRAYRRVMIDVANMADLALILDGDVAAFSTEFFREFIPKRGTRTPVRGDSIARDCAAMVVRTAERIAGTARSILGGIDGALLENEIRELDRIAIERRAEGR